MLAMGNKRLHALILVYVHNNILDNINLADVANQFVYRKDKRNKHSEIYLKIIYWNCKIKLILKYFIYLYFISYQMHKTWNCVTFYYSLNRFPPANENPISTSSKWFKMEIYERSTWFHLNWTFLNFLDFYEKKKKIVKRKKLTKIVSTKKKNPEHIEKFSGKSTQISEPFEPF